MKDSEYYFEEVYNTNYSKVYRLCLGYTSGDAAAAKDLVQDVFIKVWENLQGFRKEASLSTWIYRITVNICLMHLRKNRKNDVPNKTHVLENHSEDVPEEDKSAQFDALYNCIGKLDKDGRSIILLELEGLPQKEIAEIMGLSHDTVRVRVHRIKNKLTKCVQKR